MKKFRNVSHSVWCKDLLNIGHYFLINKKFRSLVRTKKRKAMKLKVYEIEACRLHNPHDFWNFVEQGKPQVEPDVVPMEAFFEHFSELHRSPCSID